MGQGQSLFFSFSTEAHQLHAVQGMLVFEDSAQYSILFCGCSIIIGEIEICYNA